MYTWIEESREFRRSEIMQIPDALATLPTSYEGWRQTYHLQSWHTYRLLIAEPLEGAIAEAYREWRTTAAHLQSQLRELRGIPDTDPKMEASFLEEEFFGCLHCMHGCSSLHIKIAWIHPRFIIFPEVIDQLIAKIRSKSTWIFTKAVTTLQPEIEQAFKSALEKELLFTH